jgi:hypothetical protein
MMKSCLFLLGAVVPGLLLSSLPVEASNDSLTTMVYSNVSNGYVRQKLADGSFKREFYAIANGGYAPGEVRDASIDNVKFPTIAGLVAQFLARRNYYFAQDAKSADLLLIIRWGTTIPFSAEPYQNAQNGLLNSMNSFKAANAAAKAVEDAGKGRSIDGIQSVAGALRDEHREALFGQLYQMQMFNDMRQSADERNAQVLGYVQEINVRVDSPSRFAGAGTYYDDLISDLEEARYYVIIAAYDFRAATQRQERKLLWITRVNVRAQRNRFDQCLAEMLANASRYFGQGNGHLIRRYQEGSVNIGELKVLGVEPDSPPPKKPARNP